MVWLWKVSETSSHMFLCAYNMQTCFDDFDMYINHVYSLDEVKKVYNNLFWRV